MIAPDVWDSIVLSICKCEEASGRKKRLIVVAIFLQIQPVIPENSGHQNLLAAFYGKHDSWYAFMGLYLYWESCDFQLVCLQEVVRQKDQEFVECLRRIRAGDSTCLDCINKAYGRTPLKRQYIFMPTQKWYPARTAVVSGPSKAISILGRRKYCMGKDMMQETFPDIWQPASLPRCRSKCELPSFFTATDYDVGCSKRITKVPAKDAMATPNFVNGMGGVITSVDKKGGFVTIKTEKGVFLRVSQLERHLYDYQPRNGSLVRCRAVSFTQYPFILAYAQTIHRAQGQTLGSVIVCPDTFSPIFYFLTAHMPLVSLVSER